MRRTTICRSERAALLALVAVPLACGALLGQDTTKAKPDTTKPAAAVAAPAPSQLQEGGQPPPTHVVARGETLWSISQLYFNDALLWPEIYRLNTAVIEDPHWIYPGEVLNVGTSVAAAQAPADTGAAPAESVAAAPAAAAPAESVAAVAPAAPVGDTVRAQAPPPAPADTTAAPVAVADTTPPPTEEPPPPPAADESYQTIFERPRSKAIEVTQVLRAYAEQPYRPLRRGEFYSAGFLSEGEHLPWARIVGKPDKPSIPRLTDRTTAYQYEQIVIEPPPRVSYHVGDSLLIVRIDREEGDWGDVVVPLGVAQVTEVARKQLLASVVQQFGRIHDGHLALPLEPFRDPGEVRPTPVEQGLRGHVIAQRDLHTISISQQIIFLDRGRADGVVPGDVFQIYTGDVGTPTEESRAIIEIVHTREKTSSGLILNLQNPQITPGTPVRLIRKMPS